MDILRPKNLEFIFFFILSKVHLTSNQSHKTALKNLLTNCNGFLNCNKNVLAARNNKCNRNGNKRTKTQK